MVDYKHADLFLKSNIDKQLKIATDDGLFIATNEDIHFEDFELTESLCSDSELRFGSCEASMVKFQIRNAFIPLAGKWITITETLDGNTDVSFQYGRYKVFSDKPTADREYRDIVAYDAMHDIINSSAIGWYNSILPNKNSKVTMKQFRTNFVNYFGLEQEEITLANDDMIIEKTIEVGGGTEVDNDTEQISVLKESALSGKDVIMAICEINGCFGHIGRDGKFRYIYLTQDMMGLYPSNTLFPDHAPWYLKQSETGHLHPQSPKSTRIGNGTYISADYEDFICKKINKIQIRQKENDIGGQYPSGSVENENPYIIEDNFLVYGKSAEDLYEICKNVFDKIKDIIYRPFSAECQGNPCLEVGDAVRLSTRYELIESYILKRTLKGIQALRDSYSAEGEEYCSEKVNSVSQSIIQLKGKANTLARNVDETRSELAKFEKDTNGNFLDVRSSIIQTAEDITATVSRNTQNYDVKDYDVSLFGYFEPTDVKMPYKANEHNGKYYLNQSNGNLYQSNGSSWVYIEKLQTVQESAYSEIKQTAYNITSTVSKSTSKYDTSGYDIALFGYSGAPDIPYAASENNGEYYLNQSDGNLYQSNGTSWIWKKTLSLISENLSSRISQTIDTIDLSVENGEKQAGIKITLKKEGDEETMTKEAVGRIDMTGLVSFTNLSTSGETVIDGGNIKAESIDSSKINVKTLYVEDELRIRHTNPDGTSTMRTALLMEDISGQTFPNLIVGSNRYYANIVIKNDLRCEGVNGITCSTLDVGGQSHFDKMITMSGSDIYLDKNGVTRGLKTYDKNGVYNSIIALDDDDLTTLVGCRASSDKATKTKLRGNSVVLGSSGAAVTSDERLKNSFKPLDEFDAVYMDIETCAFKYNNGTSGRYHFGAKAQCVKLAFESHGYTTQDFGGFVQMQDNPETEDYCGYTDPMGLIYTEFTMWNMHMVQKIYKKIEEQKKEIDLLKERVSFLLEK